MRHDYLSETLSDLLEDRKPKREAAKKNESQKFYIKEEVINALLGIVDWIDLQQEKGKAPREATKDLKDLDNVMKSIQRLYK